LLSRTLKDERQWMGAARLPVGCPLVIGPSVGAARLRRCCPEPDADTASASPPASLLPGLLQSENSHCPSSLAACHAPARPDADHSPCCCMTLRNLTVTLDDGRTSTWRLPLRSALTMLFRASFCRSVACRQPGRSPRRSRPHEPLTRTEMRTMMGRGVGARSVLLEGYRAASANCSDQPNVSLLIGPPHRSRCFPASSAARRRTARARSGRRARTWCAEMAQRRVRVQRRGCGAASGGAARDTYEGAGGRW